MTDDRSSSPADASPDEPVGGPKVELPPDEAIEVIESIEAATSQPDTFQPARAILWSFGLGGLGAVIWAFITVVTEYELGLIAILLGIMAGVGAARGGRTPQSQIVGAVAAAVCYFLAQLLVVFAPVFSGAQQPPPSVGLGMLVGIVLVEIVKQTFSSMGVLFLGIAVYEGYRRPRPI